jgi:hypothetical protein
MNNPEESAGAGVVSNPGRPIGLVIRRISRCGVTTRAPILAEIGGSPASPSRRANQPFRSLP